MATCATDRIAAGFRTSEKAVQQAFTSVDLHQPLGNLRGVIGLFGWRQSRFRRPSWGDEGIRTLGDAWQHAIGNVAGPGVLPDGLIRSSIAVGIVLFSGWKGGEMVFGHRLAVHAEPGAQGQPGKELISCRSPRVV
jgi:hypothetical protein